MKYRSIFSYFISTLNGKIFLYHLTLLKFLKRLIILSTNFNDKAHAASGGLSCNKLSVYERVRPQKVGENKVNEIENPYRGCTCICNAAYSLARVEPHLTKHYFPSLPLIQHLRPFVSLSREKKKKRIIIGLGAEIAEEIGRLVFPSRNQQQSMYLLWKNAFHCRRKHSEISWLIANDALECDRLFNLCVF